MAAPGIVTAGTYYLVAVGLYGGSYRSGPYTIAIRKTN
jgi:hypothetical protein